MKLMSEKAETRSMSYSDDLRCANGAPCRAPSLLPGDATPWRLRMPGCTCTVEWQSCEWNPAKLRIIQHFPYKSYWDHNGNHNGNRTSKEIANCVKLCALWELRDLQGAVGHGQHCAEFPHGEMLRAVVVAVAAHRGSSGAQHWEVLHRCELWSVGHSNDVAKTYTKMTKTHREKDKIGPKAANFQFNQKQINVCSTASHWLCTLSAISSSALDPLANPVRMGKGKITHV